MRALLAGWIDSVWSKRPSPITEYRAWSSSCSAVLTCSGGRGLVSQPPAAPPDEPSQPAASHLTSMRGSWREDRAAGSACLRTSAGRLP